MSSSAEIDAPGLEAATDRSGTRVSGTRKFEGQLLSASFRTLYRLHFSMVWRGLTRLGVPQDRIEDAVQDVFLVAHRREADFDGKAAAKTWLYGIAVRVAKDYRRAAARHNRRLVGMKQHLGALGPQVPSPAVETERKEAARITSQILDRLDPDEREVLVLVELEQLSVVETAAILKLRVRTCQRRLRAARKNFETQMEAVCANE